MVNRIEQFMVDEHHRTRERVRGLRELSPEAMAYEVEQAIRQGRMSTLRDELDYQENVKLWRATKATATIAGAAVVFAAAFMALVWVFQR